MKTQSAKSLLLPLITLLLTTSLIAQRGLRDVQANSIDLILGGDLGFRMIDGDASNPAIKTKIDNRENLENYKLNYRFGLNYYQGIGNSLSLKTGIRIANPGFTTSSIQPINPEDDINLIEKEYLLKGAEYRYQYQFIEIPLGLKYILSRSFCKPYVEGGISTNFYWRTVVEERFENGDSNDHVVVEDMKNVNFIAFLASGGDFAISRNISGFTQLVARYQINDLRADEIEERVISLGLEIGVRYFLGQ